MELTEDAALGIGIFDHADDLTSDAMLSQIQTFAKWLALISAIVMLYTGLGKDDLPARDSYNFEHLAAPQQGSTTQTPFSVEAGGETYTITPRHRYRLQGIIVSYHDADALSDIWHHEKWRDFINVRDLCVIWGDNIETEVYRKMSFENDSWTCWAYWPDAETGALFSMHQLSNNHILTDDEELKQRLLSAEPGDHIALSGVLAKYENPANGFHRDTSTTRSDTGNGACETVYLTDFEIIQKSNIRKRTIYQIAKWSFIGSFTLFLTLLFMTPVTRPNL